jgi:hypothetical protein
VLPELERGSQQGRRVQLPTSLCPVSTVKGFVLPFKRETQLSLRAPKAAWGGRELGGLRKQVVALQYIEVSKSKSCYKVPPAKWRVQQANLETCILGWIIYRVCWRMRHERRDGDRIAPTVF